MDIISILKNKEFYDTMRKNHIKLYKSAYHITNALSEINVGYTLTGGSQLAQRRIQEILPYDDDIDLAISEIDFRKLYTPKNLLHLSSNYKIALLKVIYLNSKFTGHYKLAIIQNLEGEYNFSDIVTTNVIKENDSMKVITTYQNKEIELGLNDIDLFLHTPKNKMLEYNHYGNRLSRIPHSEYENKTKRKFGPLELYSTDRGQYIKQDENVNDVPYIIYAPHGNIVKSFFKKISGTTLNPKEINFVKNFSFNISKSELSI